MQAINSLKNVESMALLQFLQPILNMLLHLIGDGGETLQVLLFVFLSVFFFFSNFNNDCVMCIVLWLLTMYYLPPFRLPRFVQW